RDFHVTGVQTCALPILRVLVAPLPLLVLAFCSEAFAAPPQGALLSLERTFGVDHASRTREGDNVSVTDSDTEVGLGLHQGLTPRSEERRVGKERRSR